MGFRVNNFVFLDIHHKDEDSWRKLYFRKFFPRLDGFHMLYRVKKGDYSYVSHPKEHLILITKNWGRVTYNSTNRGDIHGPCVPKQHQIPLIIVIPMEIICLPTNIDNWIRE